LATLAAWVLCAGQAAVANAQSPDAAALDRAFEKFWKASNPGAAGKAVSGILATGVSFDAAWQRLRAPRPLPPKPPTGEVVQSGAIVDGVTLPYTLIVPADYDPSEALAVRFQLHGGVNRQSSAEPRPPRRLLDTGAREIVVYPTANASATWWNWNQVENLLMILDRLKRAYRVDTNRVCVSGVSDGGTGAYFLAARETTPFASFLPLNGSIRVLANPDVGADGEIYVKNLALKPFFVVNGGRDPLYPIGIVLPFIELFQRAGVPVEFRPQPEAGHDVSWWPRVKDEFAAFARAHPRDPLPERIAWQTEHVDRYNRAHWLVIEKLGTAPGEASFDEWNAITPQGPRDFGIRLDTGPGKPPFLSGVLPGTDADRLGLRGGDVVVEVNGQAVSSADELLQALGAYAWGTPLRVKVKRRNETKALEATFEKDAPEVIFPRVRPSGRVELVKNGNIVDMQTRGVAELTLLLSPDAFDFDKPVRVVANGRVVFEGKVERSVKTLLTWAARDNDPAMLFGAELRITLGAAR